MVPLRARLAGLLTALLVPAARAPADALDDWLARQAELRTWSAGFTQARALPALTMPITTPGRVWFAAPDGFRWELGDPAQTIAVRQPVRFLVLYPRLRRAEEYPVEAGDGRAPWQQTLALLEAGFPRDRAALERQFTVAGPPERAGAGWAVTLAPRAAGARRFLSAVRIEFDPARAGPAAMELRFADGARLRNDFTNAVVNAELPAGLLTPEIPADFQRTTPAAGR